MGKEILREPIVWIFSLVLLAMVATLTIIPMAPDFLTNEFEADLAVTIRGHRYNGYGDSWYIMAEGYPEEFRVPLEVYNRVKIGDRIRAKCASKRWSGGTTSIVSVEVKE